MERCPCVVITARRRRGYKLFLTCLLVGILINVAGAWSFLWWGERPDLVEDFAPVSLSSRDLNTWESQGDTKWPARPEFAVVAQTPGLTVRQVFIVVNGLSEEDLDLPSAAFQERLKERQAYWLYIWKGGWPLHALVIHRGEHTVGTQRSPSEWSGLMSVGGLNLPVNPLWPGFVANSLLYALAAGVAVLLPGSMRRLWRRRHGRCGHCGYQVVASVDRCSECGMPLPPSR